jgi:ubiquinone biosynthesis protein
MSQPNPEGRTDNLVVAGEIFPNNAPPLHVAENSWYGTTLADSPDIVRRRLRTERNGRTVQAALRSKGVKVSRLWVLFRLLRAMVRSTHFYLGWLSHRLQRLEDDERQALDARRFRELLEGLGGVFIKVGQQLSQRPDILPPAYCDELQYFLKDIGDKIPLSAVEAAIKRRTGKPISETFLDFVPEPIGSASVACVYKAYLFTGEEVAVKVRRPGIEKQFTADLKGLKWILHLVEFLTIWRPGMSRNLRTELERLLFEELDFLTEARYQEIFRRYLKRRKKLRVTAPKVYYDYSSCELMVSEFVTAYKMQDIIEAVEQNNEAYLADLERDGIDPKKLAKQLVRSRYYSFHECPLFHGDPHPANILVQPNNRIVMIDFGACGVFSERDRNLMWQLNRYYSKENVAGMVNMVIGIMEPVDPVKGLYQFKKDLTDAWWQGFYGIKSKHAAGWERSSVLLWLKYFQLVREHQIPMGRNVVRMVRATLLYDTVAARLYPEINVFREFEKYTEDFARRTRRRIEKCGIRQLLQGPDDSNFLKLQQIADVGNGLLYRVQRFLDDPQFSFAAVAGKIYSAVRSFVRMLLLCGGLAIAGVVMVATYKLLSNPHDTWQSLTQSAANLPGSGFLKLIAVLWFVSAAVMVVAYGRRVYLRFGDLDD